MGTVANSNYGFKGTVSSAETPQVLGKGSLYSVEGKDDLKVTAGGTGDRAVTVAAAPNGGWGDGVLSKWTTGANLNCAANSTGSTRYDTVVIRRTWTPAGSPTGTATLMVLTGGSSAAIAAGRLTDRGVTSSDQPIALVPVPNGSAVVGTPIDLRCWSGEGGGLVAENVAALQYLGSKGTQVRIGSTLYTRMEDTSGTLFWDGPVQFADLPLNASLYRPYGSVFGAPRVSRVGDEVWLDGMIANSASPISLTKDALYPLGAAMPTIFRPPFRRVFPVVMGGTGNNVAHARLTVDASGVVTLEPGVTFSAVPSLYISLDGARWRA